MAFQGRQSFQLFKIVKEMNRSDVVSFLEQLPTAWLAKLIGLTFQHRRPLNIKACETAASKKAKSASC